MIHFLLKERFIAIWDEELKLNNLFIPRWYQNFPDIYICEIINLRKNPTKICYKKTKINKIKKFRIITSEIKEVG